MARRALITVALLIAVVVAAWFIAARRSPRDDRIPLVFWGHPSLSDEVYTLIHQFELKNPQYKVVMGTAVAQDVTGDSQRLLSAIAGGVPPDVVWFDRFAIGEWAGRDALTDLSPYLARQDAKDPYRIDFREFYPWAVEEASYKPPGSNSPSRVFGIPTEADVRILYANSDILRQAGYVESNGEPRLPKNWDDLREYTRRLTRFKTPGDKSSGVARLGFAPRIGNSWLYLFAWQAGGEFLNADRTLCTMNFPPVVRALHFMADLYDDLGGVGQVTALEQTYGGGAVDPFIQNQVVMKIQGDDYLERIADWRPDMDFVVSPPPMPSDRIDKGPISWSGGFALVIPATAKHKDGAFKFIQYLYSWEALSLMERGKWEQKQSEGKLFMPRGFANRVHYERLVKQYITDNPEVPPRIRQAYDVVKALMPKTRIRPVTPVGQLLWNQHVAATDLGTNHALAKDAARLGKDEMELALSQCAEEVQRGLDQVLAPPPPRRVNWSFYFTLYGVIVAAPFVLMYVVYRRRRKEYSYRAGEIGTAMMFASPWIISMIVLIAGPILFSIVFSFTRYDVLSPARYVGLANYRRLVEDDLFYKSIYNSLYMLIRVPLSMAVSLAIALLLNRGIRGIGIYRTAFYLPHVMPLVAASLLWMWVFNPNFGMLNTVLRAVFSLLQLNIAPPLWLQDQHWSKPALIIMHVWSAGGAMIIWLAGLQSIPDQLYEAASIDGAGPWRRFWNITVPMLSPYILFLAIIGVIDTMQIFQEAFIMTHGGTPVYSTLFYAYNLFQQAFQYFRMGYAAALAWILFVIVLALTLLELWLSKRWVHYDRA